MGSDIESLTERCKNKVVQFIKELNENFKSTDIRTADGKRILEARVCETRRDIYYQAGLYSIGRKFNTFTRKWEIENEGRIVTRTLTSKHLDGDAIDIAFWDGKTLLWPNPASPDNKQIWLFCAHVAKKHGLTPGAFFTKPDWGHYEV